jgi:hypothetical protein
LSIAGAVAFGTSGCGGAGGTSTGDTLPGLILVNFIESGEDNLALNRILQFVFNSPLEPDSVDSTSIQLRVGPAFGLSVPGRYVVEGSTVYFEPQLPGLCDLSDGGFRPDTDYRVNILGAPEANAVTNLAGHTLPGTISLSFHTRIDTDPNLFEDAVPGALPTVLSTSPDDGAWPDAPTFDLSSHPDVYIGSSNKIVIDFSENVNPCSVAEDTILVRQFAVGDQGTKPNGFLPGGDVTPGDPYTWGSGTLTSPPRLVRSTFVLKQSPLSTRLEIVPVFGEFPDNALLVVEVTNLVRDFGGHPAVPKSFAFVTENRDPQAGSRVFEFDASTPFSPNLTTADVNTTRAPNKVQGYVLFSGDGDNGTLITRASGPDNTGGPPGCLTPTGIPQANDGILDDFDPLADIVLDTGSTRNQCKNFTDGSTATVFEFRTFRIRNGVTVRLVGANPAIILVQGDVLIESGGSLLARGDGQASTPQSNGAQGQMAPTGGPNPGPTTGGQPVAGGGKGGDAPLSTSNGLSGHGATGYFMSPPGVVATDVGVVGGIGSGHGNISVNWPGPQTPANRFATAGGGGGHSTTGATGQAQGTGTTPQTLDGTIDGAGGGTYGDVTGRMLQPEAGSGGGAGGSLRGTLTTYCSGTSGCGGAGGGFVDITAKGNIYVSGRIDAAGGRGGAGGTTGTSWYTYQPVTSGGGGGSGGGVRLLTPNSIEFGSTGIVTVIGGQGGQGAVQAQSPNAPRNDGGLGGFGRIVLEDSDSVILGYQSGSTIPGDGSPGFYRGLFDSSRFQGGGLSPQMTSLLVDIGPATPSYLDPVQNYGVQEDFVAGIPLIASRGVNAPSIFVEARGFPVSPDGTPNLLAGSGWKSVGFFKDSGAETFPTWVSGTPATGSNPTALPHGQIPNLPQGNTGGSLADLAAMEFFEFRITFYLRTGMGAFDPGPYIDRWILRFTYDQ